MRRTINGFKPDFPTGLDLDQKIAWANKTLNPYLSKKLAEHTVQYWAEHPDEYQMLMHTHEYIVRAEVKRRQAKKIEV
ncbi:MAG: hypothetical protein WDZ61_00455 [Parcubacteria group bacterium]